MLHCTSEDVTARNQVLFSDLVSEGQVESASHESSNSQTRARPEATSLFHRVPGSAMQMYAGKLLSVFA